MPTPKLTQTDNGTYFAVWSESRRSKRKSMGTKERVVAENLFAQWLLLGGHKNQIGQEARTSLSVGELWQVYDEKHVCNVMAPQATRYAWKNLEPFFGRFKPQNIDQIAVDSYVQKRKAGAIGMPSVSGTIRRELLMLKAALNWHVKPERGRNRLIEPSDLPFFVPPEESAPRQRWLSEAEIEKLFSILQPGEERVSRVARFLWVALETGSRAQAILDLTWDRVDFEIGTIEFNVPGRRKTKKRRVCMPISEALMPFLERIYAERINNYVFDSSHIGSLWSAIQRIVLAAGLVEPRKDGRVVATGISPHVFRHTAATHMLRRGVPIHHTAAILGDTVATVEKTYGHHCKGKLREAVNMISANRRTKPGTSPEHERV
jgi:integrase